MSLRHIVEIIVRQKSIWILIYSTVLLDNQEIPSLWDAGISLGRNFNRFTFGERALKPQSFGSHDFAFFCFALHLVFQRKSKEIIHSLL